MSQSKGGRGGGNPGKPKKPAKAGSEEKGEDVLQAVILADSFQDRFLPFTLEKPRCLLPLANTPLIEYTLEFLAMNGVQEVFIYCGAHTEQIENYVRDSPRWSPSSRANPFASLEFIRVSDARCVGDFLRDLDKRNLISGDFILVHGDLVANIPLEAALAKHRARREANREAVMTMMLRAAGSHEHRTKMHGITPVFVVEPPSGRCLHYEEIHPLQSEHYVTLDPAVLEHPEFEVRSDLIDCGIDICTPDVLALWSESFDYELPRKHFLHGVLKDWELNGKLIHAEIVNQGYAARASNLQMYEAIARDILGRWTYPFVPDCNLVPGHSYKMRRDGACTEDGVTLASDSSVQTSVVGGKTSIGSRSTVYNSIIGRRCRIGNNVRIENSFVWDDVTIGDGAIIGHSVVASSVTIGKNASLLPGSLVSYGVHIGDDICLPAPTVLSLLSHDLSPVDHDTTLLGAEGRGAEYKDPADEDEDGGQTDPSILQRSLIYSLAHLNTSASSISTLASDEEADSDEVDSQAPSVLTSDPTTSRSRLSSFASDDSATAATKSSFHTDAVHGLVDALRETDSAADFDSAKLEFMGLRLAHDASDHSVRRAVAVAFARRAAELLAPEHGGLEPTKAADKAVRSKKGAAKFLREVGVGGSEVGEQVDFILALQKALVGVKALPSARAGTLLSALLQQLYTLDVLDEDGILAWWADERVADGQSMSTIKEKCRVLVQWLENAEEDDEDDESEDDE